MNKTTLTANFPCGFDAAKIYNDCCKIFDFDDSKAGRFGKQQSLFADEVTPEKYDVIFLAHSNRTHDKTGHVENEIAGDNSWVTEKWDDAPETFGEIPPTNDRLVFAIDPNHSRAYVFIGHFAFVSHDEKSHKSYFKRVGDTYPSVHVSVA